MDGLWFDFNKRDEGVNNEIAYGMPLSERKNGAEERT
jgi:hypothetical protein